MSEIADRRLDAPLSEKVAAGRMLLIAATVALAIWQVGTALASDAIRDRGGATARMQLAQTPSQIEAQRLASPPKVADPPVLRVVLSSSMPPVAGQDIRLLIAVEPGSEPEASMHLALLGGGEGLRASQGKAGADGTWRVERVDIPELDVTLPPAMRGAVELHLEVRSNKDGVTLARRTIEMMVEPVKGGTAVASPITGTSPNSSPPPVSATQSAPASAPTIVPPVPREPASLSASASAAPPRPPLHEPAISQEARPKPRDGAAPAETPRADPPAARVPIVMPPIRLNSAQPPPAAAEPAAAEPSVQTATRTPLPAAPSAASTGATPQVVSPPAPSAKPAIGEPRELALGKTTLATGNFAAARLLLLRAAESGSGEAALLLGSTYDAAWLRTNRARGVVPDRELALRWYREAQKLGMAEAAGRIAGLSAQ